MAKNWAICFLWILTLCRPGVCSAQTTKKDASLPSLLQRSQAQTLLLHGESYHFITHEWYLTGKNACPDMNRSIAHWELRSPIGELLAQQSYRQPGVHSDCLEESEEVTPHTFNAAGHEGVVLQYGVMPADPEYGGMDRIFVIGQQGGSATLKALGPWMQTEPGGSFVDVAPDPMEIHPSPVEDRAHHQPHEALLFNIWTHRFTVRASLPVQWEEGALATPWRCLDTSRKNPHDTSCRWKVVNTEVQKREQRSFVRLYEEPLPTARVEHLVIETNSRVELIEAELPLSLRQDGEIAFFGLEEARIGNFDDLWLHVRVDAHEGWIHTSEDYDALGLPGFD